MSEHIRSWDDLRTVLEVARAGSLSGAASALGMSHPTVYRRINQIENDIGVRLFDRGRKGYSMTAAGEELVQFAQRVEDELNRVERRLFGQDLRPAGSVRVTTTDTLLFGILSPLFAAFRERYPEIKLEVVASNHVFNISRRDADVAIRPSRDVPEDLIGRRMSEICMAIYGHRDLVEEASAEVALGSLPWIGLEQGLSYIPVARWLREQDLDRSIVYRVNTLLGSLDAVRSKVGVSVLPCYLGDVEPDLVRLGKPIEALKSELWLLTHSDLRNVARIKAFLDFMAKALRPHGPRLAGIPRSEVA